MEQSMTQPLRLDTTPTPDFLEYYRGKRVRLRFKSHIVGEGSALPFEGVLVDYDFRFLKIGKLKIDGETRVTEVLFAIDHVAALHEILDAR